MLNSENTDPRTPVIAEDVDGLQIKNISKIYNSGSRIFFRGYNVKDIAIDTPLGWKEEVIKLDK